MTHAHKCPKCLGFGTVNMTDGTVKVCPECKGKGTISNERQ